MRAMMAPAPGCSTLPVDRRALTQCRVVSRGLRRNMPQKGDIPDLSKNHNLRERGAHEAIKAQTLGSGEPATQQPVQCWRAASVLAKACSSNHRKKRESRVRDTVQSLNALGSRAVGEGSESLQLLTSPSILLQALHRCKGEEQAGTSGQNRVLHYVLVQGKLGG